MISHRIIGTFRIFWVLFLIFNLGAYVIWRGVANYLPGLSLGEMTRPLAYLPAVLVTAIYMIPRLRNQYQRQLETPSLSLALQLTLNFALVQAVTMAFTYLALKDAGFSRLFLIGAIGVNAGMSFIFVRWMPVLFARLFFSGNRKDVAIVCGKGPMPEALKSYLNKADRLGVKFVGYYSDSGQGLPTLEWMGQTHEVFEENRYRRHMRPDQVLAYTSDFRDPDFREVINGCMEKGVRVQIFSDFSSAFSDPVRIVQDGSLQFLSFYNEPLQNPINVVAKRAIDIAIALPVTVLVLPPLTLMVWLMHRIQSPGPIFFRQKRYGVSRRRFDILKYRTMHVRSPGTNDECKQACVGDPRIFSFGRFLRRTSLDEFPQFINVLKGEMSVVGPRPHLVKHDYEFEKHFRPYRSRHFVKPGITGYAQVCGYRGEIVDPGLIVKRVENDIYYITRWSLGMEVCIILKTFWQIFFPPKTAY